MPMECILCAEEVEFIGVGECNHQPICYRCTYKMRVISKNNKCPICKANLKNIIIMPQFVPYNSAKGLIPDRLFADVFHLSQASSEAFDKLTELKCFVKIDGKSCKVDKKFPSVAFLKKHLKQDHHRYICEICFEKKTCVLEQQKLYTFKALNRHMEKGDIDQFGNVTFMHPFCKFCSRYFFDQDEFRVHINLEHMTCNVCGKQQKYRYYKNYDGLEMHYKISHYICNDENCLAKKFIAFKNAEQLKLHRMQIHDKESSKKIDMKELCGFQYQGHNADDEIIVIKDNEGVNMEDQFLNLKKCKNKALGEADQQQDALLDPRVFYECESDEDQHFEEAFILKHRNQENPQTSPNHHKKKKYVSKQDLQKQKPSIAQQNQTFYFEQLNLIHTYHLSKLNYDHFEDKLKTILSNEDQTKFNAARNKLGKRQIKPNQFFQEFLKIMSNASLKSAYNIFPHYLRTIGNQDLRDTLDQIFLEELKKIPFQNNNIISQSLNYSDLFNTMVKQIEDNIEGRIRKQTLSLKKPVKRGKERLYQIIGVVRRLKIEEMAKFKYASNFGVFHDTIDFILNKIFKSKIEDIQKKLDKIETEQFLNLYIFVKFCLNSINHSKTMYIEKNKIHENILEDFLYQRPQLQKEFGLKKEDLKNLDEQVEFQKLEEERKVQQTLKEIEKKNRNKGFQIKTDFNLVDKGDFPDLVLEKKEEAKKSDKFKEVIQSVKDKPATYQKKINEMFPTLGSDEPKPVKEEPKKQEIKPPPKVEEKPWWQKINDTKKIEIDEQQGEKVRAGRKGKKKEKWVSVKGIFN